MSKPTAVEIWGDSVEDDPIWERQRTTPVQSHVQRSELTSIPRSPNDPAPTPWGRQNSTPAERPDICNTPRGAGPSGTNQVPPQWFYKDWAGEHGPRTLMQLTKALQKGYFTPQLLVRKEGTDRWLTLRDVLDLRQALRAHRMAAWKEEVKNVTAGRAAAWRSQQQQEGSALGPKGAGAQPPKPLMEDKFVQQIFRPGGPDWYYIDMQGAVQGPFKSSRMAKWFSNPQYRDHFATLRCRRGTQGPFLLLSEFTPLPDQTPSQTSSADSRLSTGSQQQQGASEAAAATKKALAAEELVKQLRAKVKELEEENEQLRQSNEDTFMLRMQVEQLYRDKAELAREVAELKRSKENLEELLQYAHHVGDEELVFDEWEEQAESAILTGGTEALGPSEDDESTEQWFEELRRSQQPPLDAH